MTSTLPLRSARRRLLVGAAAALAAAPLVLAAGPADAVSPTPVPDPVPVSCATVDFLSATVEPLTSPDPDNTKHVLTVMGVLPQPARVSLDPLVYIRQPEHWGIEVNACPAPSPTPFPTVPPVRPLPIPPPSRFFKVSLTFVGTMGSCGIDVIGATTHQTFDLAGPERCGKAEPAA